MLVATALGLVVGALVADRDSDVAVGIDPAGARPAPASPEPRAAPRTGSTPSPAAPAAEPPPSPSPPVDAAGTEEPPIVVAFAGDVHGERQIAAALAAGGHPLADIAPALSEADLAVVNLETAVGSRGQAAEKSYTFQAPPALLDELSAAGVDVVSLANNHSLDFGRAGLIETLELVDAAGLSAVGAGTDDTRAYAPSIHEIRGRTVAIVGLTRVWPLPTWAATSDRPGLAGAYDVTRAVGAVIEAKARADVVLVVVHWGQEGSDCPDEHQVELADALMAAGAAAVVGHHPHVLQEAQLVDGQLVAYSLGNFLWYTSGEVSRLTGVLRVEITGDIVTGSELVPAVIDPRDGGPRPAVGADAEAALARISRRCPPPRR